MKEGKYAPKWTLLCRMRLAANAFQRQLHAPAFNLANFLRAPATPRGIDAGSPTSPGRTAFGVPTALGVDHPPVCTSEFCLDRRFRRRHDHHRQGKWGIPGQTLVWRICSSAYLDGPLGAELQVRNHTPIMA
ncbi:MAG: hypothetical protein FJX68_17110 [Alphaproteobacteria bacterium]|nr:hypothetical protein [Alphaproteobacteria bacterium]